MAKAHQEGRALQLHAEIRVHRVGGLFVGGFDEQPCEGRRRGGSGRCFEPSGSYASQRGCTCRVWFTGSSDLSSAVLCPAAVLSLRAVCVFTACLLRFPLLSALGSPVPSALGSRTMVSAPSFQAVVIVDARVQAFAHLAQDRRAVMFKSLSAGSPH
jgi:hypothetical protein